MRGPVPTTRKEGAERPEAESSIAKGVRWQITCDGWLEEVVLVFEPER
jgi:hypothetical protein